MHEAKIHLSRLVDEAAAGECLVICKAGKPMARVTPLDDESAPPTAKRRLDLLQGACSVPDDFDHIDVDAIASLCEGA